MPTLSIARDAARTTECDVLAVPVFQGLVLGPGAKEAEAAVGPLAELAEQVPVLGAPSKQFKGDLGDAILVPTLGKLPCKQVLFVGMGDKADAKAGAARKAGAVVARRAGGGRSLATTIPLAVKGGLEAATQAFAEGLLLGSYRYAAYKAEQNSRPNRLESISILADGKADQRALRKALERAEVIAEGTALARDLTNQPSLDKSPESLAAEAKRIATNGLKVKVFDEKQLEQKGFGGILGVGRGSVKPPRLIELRYEPSNARKTIAIVGKGITFDSGGINLKPSDGLDWMKSDMGGGAAVLGAMLAIGKLKPKVRVLGYVASAENMPGGNAIRPGDVLRHYGGKTTEVGNTDAEGRLVMADAIVYAKEQGADVVIDIATLTGAMMIALGHYMFGAIGEPRSEVRKVLDAAERAGEDAWELPLYKPYRKVLDSDIADLRNVANKNLGGGAITAALFLKEFVGDTPWVHLDIAGPSKADEDRFELSKWGTGVGVRTLVEYVMSQ